MSICKLSSLLVYFVALPSLLYSTINLIDFYSCNNYYTYAFRGLLRGGGMASMFALFLGSKEVKVLICCNREGFDCMVVDYLECQ